MGRGTAAATTAQPLKQHYVDGWIYGRTRAVTTGASSEAVLAFYICTGCLGITRRDDINHVWVSGSKVVCRLTITAAVAGGALSAAADIWVDAPATANGVSTTVSTNCSNINFSHCAGSSDDGTRKVESLARYMRDDIMPAYLGHVAPNLLASNITFGKAIPKVINTNPDPYAGQVNFSIINPVESWACNYLDVLTNVSNHTHSTAGSS
jgi:hypothetical protein